MKTLRPLAGRNSAFATTFAIGALALSLMGANCQPLDPKEDDPEGKDTESTFSLLNEIPNPWGVRSNFERRLSHLPLQGQSPTATIAWPSTYWPTLYDSINRRGTQFDPAHPGSGSGLSPAQKYDLAFNGWQVPQGFLNLRPWTPQTCGDGNWDPEYYESLGPLARYASERLGNWAAHDGVDNDNDGQIDECDDYDGVPVGMSSLSAGWAMASSRVKYPQNSATVNGVTFSPEDIAALTMASYSRSSSRILAARCNGDDAQDARVDRNEYGRPTESECKDTNPGTYHVALTNIIGGALPLVHDRTFDDEVWNQPVRAYNVTSTKEISPQDAQRMLGTKITPVRWMAPEFNAMLVSVGTDVEVADPSRSASPGSLERYTRTDRYEYILEVDTNGTVVGGEWVGASRQNHPDFLWDPGRMGTSSMIPEINPASIEALLRAADQINGGDRTVDTSWVVVNQAIPDSSSAGRRVEVTVLPQSAVNLGFVTLDLDITHPYRGDLRVTLEHGGRQWVVLNREGGGQQDVRETFNTNTFAGQSSEGVWTLTVSDLAVLDAGTLNRLRLTFTDISEPEPLGPFSASGLPLEIPDNGAAVTTSAMVPAGTIGTEVRVDLDIDHSWIGDLDVVLVHGTQEWVLHSRAGGSENGIVLSRWLPFSGGDASGEWRIQVQDHADSDTGAIRRFSVIVK